MNQHSKIKFFRTLKVVFYCLGLPLFFLTVVSMSNAFRNAAPFMGTSGSEVFAMITVPLSSPAFYGIWIALAVWIVISVIQLILHFTVKNPKARLVGSIAAVLICMLVPVLVMDTVMSAKIDKIAAEAPAGVVVKNYNDQLSYYRSYTSELTDSGKIANDTDLLKKQVNKFCEVYNITYHDVKKDGTAGNTANNAIFYDQLGIDYNKNGSYNDKEDHVLVRVAPTGAKFNNKGVAKEGTGWLEINGKKYDGYFFVCREVNGKPTYLWYSQAKMPEYRDGTYGLASYNTNGLLSDGYIFSVDVALAILEDYYGAQEEINALLKYLTTEDGYKSYDEALATIQFGAMERRAEYYTSTPELEALWNSEELVTPNYTLTNGELDTLVSILIAAIGSSSLFDLVFELLLGDSPLKEQLANGMPIGDLVNQILGLVGVDPSGGLVGTIMGLLDSLLGKDCVIVLKFAPTSPDDPTNYLTLGFKGGIFTEKFGPDGFMLNFDKSFTIDKIDELLDGFGLGGILKTILGLVGLNVTGDTHLVREILNNLLEGLYWYKSPLILPEFDERFYIEDEEGLELPMDGSPYTVIPRLQLAFSKYQRALYEGGMHGYMIGSALIPGASMLSSGIGGGAYAEANGLSSLLEVQQLRTDLSYKPVFYPIFSARDMLMTFAGIVIFFMIMSHYAAEKEIEWASGRAVVSKKDKNKKKKGNKKRGGEEEPNNSNFNAVSATGAENTALNVSENTDKEVK